MTEKLIKSDEEIAPTIPSLEDSVERTLELYPNIIDLKNILPVNLLAVVNCFDEISHAHFDSIAVSTLCVLPCLCSGAKVSQEKGMKEKIVKFNPINLDAIELSSLPFSTEGNGGQKKAPPLFQK